MLDVIEYPACQRIVESSMLAINRPGHARVLQSPVLTCFVDHGFDVACCFELVMKFVFSIKTLIYMYNLNLMQEIV